MPPPTQTEDLAALRANWLSRWETALAAWSRFTKLAEPRWCLTADDEEREKLRGSFAMIRLVDHAVVISLCQIRDLRLQAFATEILAHEVGHHVLAPGDLRDDARLLARIRAGLPTREQYAGLAANLYADLLINDRLQRSATLDMGGVYRALRRDKEQVSDVWRLYMRIYEILWGLQSGTLIPHIASGSLQGDAVLGAKIVRVYARDWLKGAGRFAALLLPYLLEFPEQKTLAAVFASIRDTEQAGDGADIPDGLVEIEEGETDVVHPSEDEAITGESPDGKKKGKSAPRGGGREQVGGHKNPVRSPTEYVDLMKGIGVRVPEKDLLIRYYRELAIPYLIRFPRRISEEATDPHPEGVDAWDTGEPVTEIDWTETLARGPYVIPGVTTVKRLYGASPGTSPERVPLDLYIGIDCSGSMGNPAYQMSYPVLAATVITVSALRAGARIMACLSGEEPGEFCETEGFRHSEKEILNILTNYLGTGYSFGIQRLKTAFLDKPPPSRPVHILVVSDSDMFRMLGGHREGWSIAQEAVRRAGGGGTFVLQVDPASAAKYIGRMKDIGWDVYTVRNQAELVAFARGFSRAHYERIQAGAAPRRKAQ